MQTLKTFQFKQQHRISRDPLANNDIWANDVRQAIRSDLATHGIMEATNGNPDFYVAFYVGLKDRSDLNYVGYGLPVFHRGFRAGWWGWPRGYDAWAVPYTESTVIVDVIDAHTNQLVWRGYDTNTLNTKNPDAHEGGRQRALPVQSRREGGTGARRMTAEHTTEGRDPSPSSPSIDSMPIA